MGDGAGAAGIQAGGEVIGGIIDAVGQSAANRREARLSATQAGTLNELIREFVLPSDTSGLEAQANSVITRGQAGLNASMGARGLVGSGATVEQNTALRSQVLGGLASDINQDQASRAALAGELFSNPVFGFYDPNTGKATNQQGK